MNPRSIVFCLLLLRAASGLAQPLPPGAPLFGKTMAEWSVDWVDWVYAPCTNENPVLDPDGRWAGVGQPATPVFFAYRATSPVFSLDLPITCSLVSFLFGPPFSGLDDPIVADGYYLMLQPLTLGEHLLVFGGTVGPPNGFTISSTAHLNVVEV